MKNLPCGHPCVAFCGEPCPKACFMCDDTCTENFSDLTKEKRFSYIYLEDCQHTLKEDDLRKSLVSHSLGLQKFELKTCPQCGTVIRTNLRFNKIIKSCISDLEKIKQMTKFNKDKNLNLQRNLLKCINESFSNINYIYKPVKKILSGGRIRDIYELTNLESIMQIAKEIEFNYCDSYPKSDLTPFIEKMIVCMQFSRECMTDFIGKNCFSVSEYQLQQLSKEVYRMSLLSFLLNYAKQKQFTSLSPEFENCASEIIHFNSLSDENIENFKRRIKKFVTNLQNVPTKISYPQEIVNMSALWYRCPNGHFICLSNSLEASQRRDCYKCRKVVNNKQNLKVSKTHAEVENESKSDEFDKALDENTKPISDDNTVKQSRKFSKKDERYSTGKKMELVGKKTDISSDNNRKFRRKFCPDVEFSRKSCISIVSECGYSDRGNASRKSFEANGDDRQNHFPTSPFKKPVSKNAPGRNSEKSSHEAFLKQTRTFNCTTSKDNFSGNNTEKSCDGKLLRPTGIFNRALQEIMSRKQTEVTDEKISRIIKAFSELSVEKEELREKQ